MRSLADEIINESIENVAAILRYGTDVNQIDEYGFTPLVEAAIADNIEIIKLLITHGADVNLPDTTGHTALHWAAENNNLEIAALLLKQNANPNAYTFSGQPVLVMPFLRNQEALKKLLLKMGADLSFTQDYVNAKLLGHIFELVGTANIVDPQNNYVEIDFEGFYLEVSLRIIAESLTQFQNHFAARKLRRYSEISKNIIEVIDRSAKLIKYQHYRINLQNYVDEIDELIDKDPILIPVGYEGHAITFVKMGTIFAKCDRREDSRLYDNIVFYQMTRQRNFNQQLIKHILFEKKSSEFVNEELPEELGLKPVTELKIEAQISGNCSWANVEATIPTLFFLLLMYTQNNPNNISEYKSIALNFFHQWSEWNKNRALHFCIESFNNGDSIRNVCKAEILAAILFQRCRYENFSDRERIESILGILFRPAYQHILDNYIKTYCYESQSEEGKAFKELLARYGYVKK